jgi:ribosomal protein S14
MIKASNSQTRKNPISINEPFKCKKCGKQNPAAKKTCRNHCRNCLYSLHVDVTIPGDRESTCLNLMEPVLIDFDNKKGYQITHKCLVCGKEIVNKLADDDNLDLVSKIMQIQNMNQQINDKHARRKH